LRGRKKPRGRWGPDPPTGTTLTLIFIRNLSLFVLYIALSSEIVFFWFCSFVLYVILTLLMCLLFDVRLSHLINITYIHYYIHTYIYTYFTETYPTGLLVEESIRMTEDRDKSRKYDHGVANRRIIEDG